MKHEHSDRPASFAVFVGRTAELTRLSEMVATVPATIVVGVAGVGKSALAQAFSAGWQGRVVRQRVTDAPASALLDDVRRQLAREAVDDAGSDEARVRDIARRLAAERGLWVLDDFHRLADADQAVVLEAFGHAAGVARLVATSRQAPLPRAGLVDHAELRLLPLDHDDARALWKALDALYGISDRFDVAWQRSHGLPILLRQAHAGGFDQADPIEGAVRALSDDERLLAGALALSEVPLPARALVALRPAERSGPALRGLVRRLIVDIDGAEQCTLHDLFAAGVRAALSDDERKALHRAVAHALLDAELDPAIRARHVSGHLIAAGCPAEAADWLVHQARAVTRLGAASEFVRAVDAIPVEYRSIALRVERARALLRALDMGRALAELRQLLAGDAAPSEDLHVSLAQVALLAADARLARDTLARLVEHPAPDASPRRRVRAAVTYALACAYLGCGEDGRRLLASLQGELADPRQVALLAAYSAFTLWLEDRDDEALEALRGATALLDKDADSYRDALVPGIFGVILARHGRLDEAEQMLLRCERILARQSDLLFQLELQFGRALFRHESGDRLDALERFQVVDRAYSRAGYVLGTLYNGLWLVRALFLLGRRAEANEQLGRIVEAARARGLGGILAAAERVCALDPLRAPGATLPSPSRRALVVRARALAAVRLAAAGDLGGARDLVAANTAAAARPGYAFDRALAHVVDAVAARLDGDEAALEAALGRALGEADVARGDGFDAELPRALVESLGRVRVVGVRVRRLVSTVDVAHLAPVVIDARTHELRSPHALVSLRGRPIVRRLLYALAARAGHPLSKEALVAAAWERDYSPLQHDNPLKSNVGHLRRLISDTGIAIVSDEAGYRLELPSGAMYVDAV